MAVLVVVAGLWVFSGLTGQSSVHQQVATVQAEQTAVARPTPTATP
ncbi:MAG TPA: hypothetical protein VFB58_03305 [Chloroflexota bacterium]|nr:hypothetical protein [Chloroflexota bacterium]